MAFGSTSAIFVQSMNNPLLRSVDPSNITLPTGYTDLVTDTSLLVALFTNTGTPNAEDTLANIGYNTVGPNPLNQLGLEFATSRQLNVQLQNSFSLSQSDAGKYWFYGDPAAFAYMENWPITVTQAPTNSEAEFTQDVVVRFKASESGNWGIWDPRVLQRNNYQATA